MTEENKDVEIDEDFLSEAMDSETIFTSDEAVEGLMKQAEALGVDPETVDLNKKQRVLYARKNCHSCFGKGVVSFVPSPAKPKKIKLNLAQSLEKTTRKSRVFKTRDGKWHKKPTQKRLKLRSELPGNELGKVWNTRGREPDGYKKELKQHLPCRCVRTIEV